MLIKKGFLLLETPNLTYWPNRVKLLKGESILPPIETIYKSEIPFTGHHHEYTIKEIKSLAEITGFNLVKITF